MSMSGAMSAAISGLKTHMQALNVVGNNIANVNTNGYKAQRFTFKESIYNTLSAGSEGTASTGSTNPKQIGYGCQVGTIDLDMTSGDLNATGRDMDCAIGGDGFFLVGPKDIDIQNADDAKSLYLSRVGDFEFRDGYLTDGQGNVVYGFVTSTADDGSQKVSTDLVPIRLPMSSKGSGTAGQADYVAPGTAVYPTINGNGENVNPDDPDSANVNNVDGYINYTNMKIDANGKITCTNSDTKEVVEVGYIALGNVENPNGVLHTQGPYYQAGDAAGDITISAPNSAVTGYLRNQAAADADPGDMLLGGSTVGLMTSFLEGSSTDLATEFTNMILYQRGYQANTRIVTVTDTMLEELVNMKR